MNLIRKLLNWWKSDPEPDDPDDLIMQIVVSRAFETGNMVIANQQDDGTVEIQEIIPTSRGKGSKE